MDLEQLIRTYRIKATGVLHLGAHLGEEADAYDDVGMPQVIWIEADPRVYERLTEALQGRSNHRTYRALLDRQDATAVFHVANNGQSSSLLGFGTHTRYYPEIRFVEDVRMSTVTVDRLWSMNDWTSLNFWNLDLQGAELRVLEGATNSLAACDYLYCEVNREPLYEHCVLVEDLDTYLGDFARVVTQWTEHQWGDALYIRRALL